MKLAWAISVFIATFNQVKTRSTELTIELKTNPRNVPTKTNIVAIGESEMSEKKNETWSPIQTHHITSRIWTAKDSLMPKIEIRQAVSDNNMSPHHTTRRPLMAVKIFTSKPHAVHYIHSRPFGNLNAQKHSKTHNRRNNHFNKIEHAKSVEDRFRYFTNVNDIDEPRQNNRRGSSRRVHALAAAASTNVESVALPMLPYTNSVRSKAKLAIEQSLQKIKSVRPELNVKTIAKDPASSKKRDSTKRFKINNAEINIVAATDVTIPIENARLAITTTERIDLSPNETDRLVYSATTTEKADHHARKTKNLSLSAIKTEKLITPPRIIEKSDHADAPIKKPVSFAITTDQSGISITEMIDAAEVITNDKIVNSETTAESSKSILIYDNDINTTPSVGPINQEDELIRTTGISSRHKRRINIIEEERMATTSTGFNYSERGTPIGTDFTYKNIHT